LIEVSKHSQVLNLIKLPSSFQNIQDLNQLHVDPIDLKQKVKQDALAKLTNRLVVYNEKFEDYSELQKIAMDFKEEVKHEVSQVITEIPII
jgi:hypothetical protein